jgi:hypothetical protein
MRWSLDIIRNNQETLKTEIGIATSIHLNGAIAPATRKGTEGEGAFENLVILIDI